MKNCIKREEVSLNFIKFVRTTLFFITYFYGKHLAVTRTTRHDSDVDHLAFLSAGGFGTGLT